MKKAFLFSLLFVPFWISAQVCPLEKPTRHLKSLSINEINAIFEETNAVYKQNAVREQADTICKKLNGTLLIAQNDEIIARQSKGFLVLDDSLSPKMTMETCFELASISKQFTAASVLQLVIGGKLALEDSLTKFFPTLPYSGITVHNLLAHTSGLPEYFDFKESWFPQGRLTTNQDVVDVLVARHPKILFKPGENYEYTNTNYALLALIVEQVSGGKFEEYVRKNLLEPAGMKHAFYVTEIEGKRNFSIATGHKADRVPRKLALLDGTFGDKGLYSTVDDLFAWKKAYFNDFKILPEEWVRKATEIQDVLNNQKIPEALYGYGWHLEANPHYGMLIYHGGYWHGFHHIQTYYPPANIYIVFLSNYCNRAHRGQTSVIMDILCGA